MKKTYVKPMVAFESFQMTSNVAGDCETKISNQSKDACGLLIDPSKTDGPTVFLTEAICSFTTPDDESTYACYHVPTDDNNIFNS